MSFVVSARKYRPLQFRDVVGQSHITTTLKNAIKSGKIAQSFLFCGPRGVGKTTCARILAKTLNCQNPTADCEPCGECTACVSFAQSASFNIFELDAASNNSVEDIRHLIEQVRFAPQTGRYKIYIIDEVHMLSQAAFNAFLKTLEEPPSYAIFILATTEKHKILPTILSRCQIFDFHRISVADMVEHLKYIADDQNIQAQEDALFLIAQKADGGLRDALSIFDRIASYTNSNILYENVIDSLNILDYDYFFKITDALLLQDTPTVLLLFDKVLQNGFEGDSFIGGLSEHFRNLLVCKTPQTLQLLELTQGLKNRYQQQAQLAPSSYLLSALSLANQCEINYKNSKNKRLQVELTLLKMAFIPNALQFSDTAPAPPPVAVEKKNLASPPPPLPSQPPITSSSSAIPSPAELQQKKQANATPKIDISSLDRIKEQEHQQKQQKKDIAKHPLTPELVTSIWQNYCQTLVGIARSLCENSTPIFSENTIQFTVKGKLNGNTLEDLLPAYLALLERETGINGIQRKIIVEEIPIDKSQVAPSTLLSSQDLLEKMTRDNPLITQLIQQFDLK